MNPPDFFGDFGPTNFSIDKIAKKIGKQNTRIEIKVFLMEKNYQKSLIFQIQETNTQIINDYEVL